jgi:hypothetical protein
MKGILGTHRNVGLYIYTSVTIETTVIRVVTERARLFGRIYRLYLQCKPKQKVAVYRLQASAGFLIFFFTLQPGRWR